MSSSYTSRSCLSGGGGGGGAYGCQHQLTCFCCKVNPVWYTVSLRPCLSLLSLSPGAVQQAPCTGHRGQEIRVSAFPKCSVDSWLCTWGYWSAEHAGPAGCSYVFQFQMQSVSSRLWENVHTNNLAVSVSKLQGMKRAGLQLQGNRPRDI